MFFKLTRIVFILISALLMLKFALSKLQSMPISVKSFTMFSQILPINAEFFMYFTGFIELLIATLLIVSLFIKKEQLKDKLQIIGFSLLFSTMFSAILIEYFVRPTPVSFLVTIALVLIIIAISELSILTQKKVK